MTKKWSDFISKTMHFLHYTPGSLISFSNYFRNRQFGGGSKGAKTKIEMTILFFSLICIKFGRWVHYGSMNTHVYELIYSEALLKAIPRLLGTSGPDILSNSVPILSQFSPSSVPILSQFCPSSVPILSQFCLSSVQFCPNSVPKTKNATDCHRMPTY